MPRESAIVDRIIRNLKKIEGCYAEKTHGGLYGNAGKPDVTACLDGRRLEIEVKQPGEKSTPLQRKMQDRWRGAGAFVFEAHSWEELKSALSQEGLLRD